MPWMKMCSGCHTEIDKFGPPRCSACESKRNRDKEANSNRERAFYNTTEWKQTRLLQLNREPLCRFCSEQGRVEPATVADHVVPIADGGDRLVLNNLRSLCKPHHDQRTRRDQNEAQRKEHHDRLDR